MFTFNSKKLFTINDVADFLKEKTKKTFFLQLVQLFVEWKSVTWTVSTNPFCCYVICFIALKAVMLLFLTLFFWRMSFEGLKAFMDSTHKTIFKRLVLWIQLVRPKFSKKIWFNLTCEDLCTNLTSLKNVKLSLDLFEKNWKMFCPKLYT